MKSCAINGKLEQLPDERPLLVELGTIQEWRVQNVDLHAFHLQGSPVQLIDASVPAPTSYWQVVPVVDTLLCESILEVRK